MWWPLKVVCLTKPGQSQNAGKGNMPWKPLRRRLLLIPPVAPCHTPCTWPSRASLAHT